MDGKIFSFDLQRFDEEFAWSIGSGTAASPYQFANGTSSIASLSFLNNDGWSLSASNSGTISIAANDTTAAFSLVSNSINDATARTIFDASSVTLPFYFKFASNTPITSITGGSSGASIDATSSSKNMYIGGGSGADLLKAGSGGSILDGKGGANSLVGGKGKDYFVYGGSGTTSIGGFTATQDFISLTGVDALPGADSVGVEGTDLVLNFGTNSSSLKVADASANTVKLLFVNGNSNDTYYYSAGLIDKGHKAVSLTSEGSVFSALDSGYSNVVSIDASGSEVNSGVSITLNNRGDYFIGSSKGNSITDGTGADFISLSSSSDIHNDIFKYNSGADSIVGYGAGDSIKLNNSKLKLVTDGTKLESLEGQAGFKLTFGTGNTLTFTDVVDNTAVSVYGSGSTTPYEYTSTAISLKGSNSNDSVTLGSSYDSASFDGSNFTFINAAAVSKLEAFSIKGGDSASYIYGSDNKFTSITSGNVGTGINTLEAGKAGAYLVASGGSALLKGNASVDTFIYEAGSASIQNYTYSGDYEDVVSLTGTAVTLPTTFDTTQSAHASYKGRDYVVSLGGDSSLTFTSKQQFALAQGNSTYTYTHNSIALDSNSKHGITIGGSYYTSKTFNGASEANSKFVSINASEVNHAIRVTGNDNDNYMVASSLYGGTLLGGDKNDTLQAGSVGAYMDGGDGDVLYKGSTDKTASIGADTFVYRGNAASIQNYNAGDIVNFSASDLTITGASVSSASVQGADASSTVYNLTLDFTGGNKIIFQSLTSYQATKGVSLRSGRSNLYVYKKDSVTWNDKSITLTADYAGEGTDSLFSAADKASLVTINAALVGQSITGDATFSIAGNDNNNYIIGSTIKSNSISGGAGNDTLVGNAASLDVFHYTAGKDVILGFDTLDNFSISSADLGKIKTAKASRNNLTFTIDNTNTIAFRSNDSADVPTMVSLSGEGYLTKDGVVSKNDGKYSLKLFSNAKGTIDLTDTALYGNTTITSLNATLAAKQGLTVVAKSVDGSAYYNFAPNNKKRDTFEYGGGAVSITGFESGKDRLNISSDTITSFSISGDTVVISLNADGSGDAVSLSGAKGNEILVRANGARGYSKMVFKDAGVLENRTKNPTSVTLSTGAASYSAENSTVKKITVTDIDNAISIYAGAKGSIVDASGADKGVSLIGGAKADKFTGSNYTDVFFYDTKAGGKDVLNSFVTGDTAADSIKFGRDGSGSASLLSDAKISAGNKAIKFKFANKDVLTVKGDSMKDAKLQIADTKYSYSKNALVDETNVSLTSAFGGTYKVANGVNYVDGHLSEKNLTFKVTSAGTDETLIGGKKKTTFKGAGGTDSLVGGTGDDVFFYARGDNGTATIANFDIKNDKLKIAGGTLRNITFDSSSHELTFNMSAKNSTDDPEIGHFNIQSFYNKDTEQTETLTDAEAKKTLIHTNGTYYWFATGNVTEEVTTEGGDGSTVTLAKEGDLITWSDKKVTSSLIKDYDVIELNYGTNLVKSGVATLVSSKATNAGLPT